MCDLLSSSVTDIQYIKATGWVGEDTIFIWPHHIGHVCVTEEFEMKLATVPHYRPLFVQRLGPRLCAFLITTHKQASSSKQPLMHLAQPSSTQGKSFHGATQVEKHVIETRSSYGWIEIHWREKKENAHFEPTKA